MRTKRGIALALTLIVLSVMTMVSIAFFQAYHSHFSITRASRDSETAFAGCEAAFDYVAYRLEHDRDWGSADFTADDQTKDPASPLIVIQSKLGSHEFEGSIPGSGATINGTIYNNLAGVLAEDTLVPPAGTARCQLEVKSNDATRRVEFLVRVAPLFDSSALSRADLDVNAQSLTLRSLDANRNMLRSEQDIYVPDMLNGAERTKFYKPQSPSAPGPEVADKNGLLWAKGDIYSYDQDAPGMSEMVDEGDEIAEAQASSNGKIASGASSHFSVFDMKQEQVLETIPASHSEIPLNNPFTGAPMSGRFTFTRRKASVTLDASYYIDDDDETETVTYNNVEVWVDVLEYYENPDSTVPTAVFRAEDRVEDLAAQIPATKVDDPEFWDDLDTGNLVVDSINPTISNIEIPGYSGGLTTLPDNKLIFKETPTSSANLTFDLMNQEVTATHDAYVQVDGEFHVTSESQASADAAAVVQPPKLNLGYVESPDVEGGVSKAVIRAKGTIDINQGITEGLGALVSSEGDVKIRPKNTNTVTVDSGLAGSGLLIFAGRDVDLTSPAETNSWYFKGLVYARGGIRMQGAPEDAAATPSATFEGSIVALNDPASGSAFNGIKFEQCEDIEFIYSSKMLEAYVAQLPGERIQVETVYWRE